MNTGTNSIMGKFVGQDVEGPPGVIGAFHFAAASFEKGALRGSFGAERAYCEIPAGWESDHEWGM